LPSGIDSFQKKQPPSGSFSGAGRTGQGNDQVERFGRRKSRRVQRNSPLLPSEDAKSNSPAAGRLGSLSDSWRYIRRCGQKIRLEAGKINATLREILEKAACRAAAVRHPASATTTASPTKPQPESRFSWPVARITSSGVARATAGAKPGRPSSPDHPGSLYHQRSGSLAGAAIQGAATPGIES